MMWVSKTKHPAGVEACRVTESSDPTRGGSWCFQVLADDGKQYWCKTFHTPQGKRAPVTEQIVARLAALLGAPVCEAQLVRVPNELPNWPECLEPRSKHLYGPWIHGSLTIDDLCQAEAQTLDPEDRTHDDNARGHAGIYAIWDWLQGGEGGWLVRKSDRKYFSHDHAWWLPGAGHHEWHVRFLVADRDLIGALDFPPDGLDPNELERLATQLNHLRLDEIVEALCGLPQDWPVLELELDAVAEFAYGRREPVAQRLRDLTSRI